ncbi:rho GDP-dissociation inhibitor 3 isoform X2 [Phycodurus eques]|uniref:rho GDP-dissociation inhibitor 3 isoform X2 n=1 Tax=Phycodurus eques TaxID=693459 RepID=UPI002ACE8A81|nr:rho GDP-dissociation inhibitor 3 isoform X2 [Phycodurus eques]
MLYFFFCYLWRFPSFPVLPKPVVTLSAAPQQTGSMLGLDACEFGGQVLELLWLTMCYRGFLIEKRELPLEEEEDDRNLNYNPPAQKTLQEIQDLDKDDESLVKYKQTLLGVRPMMADFSGPNVQVTKLTLLFDEAPGPITINLTDVTSEKEQTFTLKEAVKYRLKIHFKVNKEIVAGLKYHHVSFRKGLKMDKVSYMMGSYCPRENEHEFVLPSEETPQGLVSRGLYQIKSHFTDDDKNIYSAWDWNLEIKKDLDE